jgi:colanic acid/amylovoran biosynthesis glycosyltransferase
VRAPRVAVATEDFLPYTHVWIYRQMFVDDRRPALVLCRRRSEQASFPFEPSVCSPSETSWVQAAKARLWRFFRHVPARLSRRNRRDFADAIRRHRVELVHAHFATMGVMMAPLCRAAGIPLLVTFHGFDVTAAPRRWPAYAKQISAMLRGGAHVAAITKEMAAVAGHLGADAERIHLSYLGVPVAQIPFVERTGRDGPVHFLHAGRLTAKKGVPDLVRAFAKAFPAPGQAVLTIAGDGEESQMARKAVEQSRPANEVRLLGRVADAELVRLRAEADVFVANCRTDDAGTREGLPIAILEAAATGLPVLSTWHAGIPESVADGVTGLLVPERDEAALAEGMRRMMDAEERVKWGREGRRRMEETFDLEACNRRLWNIYGDVCAKQAGGVAATAARA